VTGGCGRRAVGTNLALNFSGGNVPGFTTFPIGTITTRPRASRERQQHGQRRPRGLQWWDHYRIDGERKGQRVRRRRRPRRCERERRLFSPPGQPALPSDRKLQCVTVRSHQRNYLAAPVFPLAEGMIMTSSASGNVTGNPPAASSATRRHDCEPVGHRTVTGAGSFAIGGPVDRISAHQVDSRPAASHR
jgi:hypothetical protein